MKTFPRPFGLEGKDTPIFQGAACALRCDVTGIELVVLAPSIEALQQIFDHLRTNPLSEKPLDLSKVQRAKLIKP